MPTVLRQGWTKGWGTCNDNFASKSIETLALAIALVFTSLTVLSVLFGARLPLGGFYGLVLGGWLLKIVLFALLMAALQRMDFIHGPTLFFAIVLSVLGSLSIDSWVVLRSRIPTIDSRD
jgi:hypothetical protein